MSLFGMSAAGKKARDQQNGIAGQQAGWGSQWGNNANEQYGQAGDLRNQILWNNQDLMDNGMGAPDDVRNQGKTLLGDQSGYLDEQRGTLNGLQSDYNNNYANPGQMMGNLQGSVSGYRGQQGQNIHDNMGTQNGLTQGGYDKVRGNTQNYANGMGGSADQRMGDLSQKTNDAYNAMDARQSQAHQALIGQSNDAYDTAHGNLTAAMDANGATAMRATAPLAAAAKARARAAGVDPGSPEAASMMAKVDQTRAHALDDNLAGNIQSQNQLTLGKQQQAQGLALDQVGQTNQLAQGQNQLNRSDTNQLYDTRQNVMGTQMQNANAADMGQYQDTRANTGQAYQDSQGLLNTQAQDAYNQTGVQAQLQQQDFGNRAGMANAQNNVSQQGMDYMTKQGQAGLQYANQNAGVKIQGVNNQQQAWNTQYGGAGQWANTAGNMSQAAAGNYGNIYNQENQNSNWLGKGLVGAAAAVGGAYAGGYGKGKGGK